MVAKDNLLAELEAAQKSWDQASTEGRKELVRPFANAIGLENFPKLRFGHQPEIVQLMVAMSVMSNELLNDLAIREGYLDLDARSLLHRNAVIAAIAGSINRGSTATESSSYRRPGAIRWSKDDEA